MAEWLKAPVLKTGIPKGNVGSNPTPSATVDVARQLRVPRTISEFLIPSFAWQLGIRLQRHPNYEAISPSQDRAWDGRAYGANR